MPPTIVDFDYHLPPELIAQHPAPRRDSSRLMVVDRARRSWRHSTFGEFPEILDAGDVLVLIDPRQYELTVASAKADLELAGQETGAETAGVAAAEANLADARAHLRGGPA